MLSLEQCIHLNVLSFHTSVTTCCELCISLSLTMWNICHSGHWWTRKFAIVSVVKTREMIGKSARSIVRCEIWSLRKFLYNSNRDADTGLALEVAHTILSGPFRARGKSWRKYSDIYWWQRRCDICPLFKG